MTTPAHLPRITVVTPSFNQARFLRQTMESIHSQAYPNLEHIVLDAGSTDGSVDIIRAFEPRLAYWHSRRDSGQSDAINQGFSRATGDILTWINSDDLLAPGALFAMAAAFADPSAPAWAVGRCICIDESGNEMRRWESGPVTRDRSLDWGNHYLLQPAVFWTRALWDRCGPLDESLHYAMDFDVWLEFFRVAEPRIVDAAIGMHRSHGATKTSTGIDRTLAELGTAIDKRLSGWRRMRARHYLARQYARHANIAFFENANALSRRLLRGALGASMTTLINPRVYQVLAKHVVGRTMVDRWWRTRARLSGR